MASQFLQRIVRSNPRKRDSFGSTIKFSSDGSVMAITSPGVSEISSPIIGAISIYNLSGGQWVFVEDIVLPNYVVALDHAGAHLEMNQDGSIIVIPIQNYDATPLMNGGVLIYGLSGSTYVFRNLLRISPRIKPPSGNVLNIFGFQVAMSHDGNTLAVSAPWDVNAAQASVGGVYVLETTDNWTNWTYKELFHDENGTQLGLNLAISGNGKYIFAGRDDPSNFGSVLAFRKPGNAWWDYTDGVLPKVLVASDQLIGDSFGFASHAVQYLHTAGSPIAANYDATRLFIGSPFKNSDAGQVYVFDFNPLSVTYDEVQIITNVPSLTGDFFGWSLSTDDLSNVLIIGAQGEDALGFNDVGVNHLFELNPASGNYEETEKISSPTPSEFAYGSFRVELSNNTKYLAAGSIDETVNGLIFAGVVNIWQVQRTPPVRPQRYRALVTVEEANLSATSAQLNDINSGVNQDYKWDRKKVVNTDTGGTIVAQGPAPSDPWEFDTGGIAHTPSGSATYSQLVFAARPDAYYQQDEAILPTFFDSIGSQNATAQGAGAIPGSDTLKFGDPKTSVRYPSGAGSRVLLAANSNLHNNGDIAIESIIKLDSLDSDDLRPIATKGTSVNDPDMDWQFLVAFNNRLRFQSSIFPSYTLDTPDDSISLDIRHYVVVNLSADGDIEMFIDGVSQAVGSEFPRVVTPGHIYMAHEAFAADYLRGWQSDTAFYGRLLTQAEITQRSNKAILGT